MVLPWVDKVIVRPNRRKCCLNRCFCRTRDETGNGVLQNAVQFILVSSKGLVRYFHVSVGESEDVLKWKI